MTDELEAAAKRVYAVIPAIGEWRIRRLGEQDELLKYKILRCEIPWDETEEDYRDHCRRLAAAALGVEEPTR